MSTNAEVQKMGAENALSTIRKFSRRVQGTGIIKLSRARRYHARNASKTVQKKRALKLLKRRSEYRQKIKEGKIIEAPARTGMRTQSSAPREGGPARFGESTPIAR